MNKCKCGCGADAPEGKGFLPGHWSKWNAKNKANREQQKPEEPKQPEEPRITVSNIRACGIKSENVAWFKTAEGYIFKEIEFYCTITHENKNEQCDYVAVILEDGSIMPAVLLPGFAGIFDKFHIFEEEAMTPKEFTEKLASEMSDKPLPPPENPAISQPDEPKYDDSEALRKLLELPKPEKKKGLLAKLFPYRFEASYKKTADKHNESTEVDMFLEKNKNAT